MQKERQDAQKKVANDKIAQAQKTKEKTKRELDDVRLEIRQTRKEIQKASELSCSINNLQDSKKETEEELKELQKMTHKTTKRNKEAFDCKGIQIRIGQLDRAIKGLTEKIEEKQAQLPLGVALEQISQFEQLRAREDELVKALRTQESSLGYLRE